MKPAPTDLRKTEPLVRTDDRRLLETYRTFAEEQMRLNAELKLSEQALEQSNESLIASRQRNVLDQAGATAWNIASGHATFTSYSCRGPIRQGQAL